MPDQEENIVERAIRLLKEAGDALNQVPKELRTQRLSSSALRREAVHIESVIRVAKEMTS